tara:strand:- start:3586 stop:4947 length:1362 start_codon:yes stop_codon:yes gene_type:complete
MAIRYQSGFIGSRDVSRDSEAQALVDGLNTFARGFNTFAKAKGDKITKQTTAEAEKTARLDNLKSYQDGVDSGKLDGTQSEFWISVYDNVKGQNAGAEFQTSKAIAYNEWWAENVENDDYDGSLFQAWSSDFDSKYMEANKDQSNFYLKGVEGFIKGTNANLGASYATSNAQKLKTKGKQNVIKVIEGVIGQGDVKAKIAELDVKTNLSRFLTKDEFNASVIQAYKNKIAALTIKGDPSSDYDTAIDLVDQLIDFKRANGSKIVTGANIEAINELKQKITLESITHESVLDKVSNDNKISDFYVQEEKTLVLSFWDPLKGKGGTEGKEISDRAKDEYEQRSREWLKLNDDADPLDKKQYLIELRQDLVNKYETAAIKNVSLYSPGNNKFNIQRQLDVMGKVLLDFIEVNDGDRDVNKEWYSLARLNGYPDTAAGVTEFLSNYLKILKAEKGGS